MSKDSMTTENNLTIDWEGIEGILKGIQVDIALYEPVRPVHTEGESLLVLEQRGLCRLSDETRGMEEERLARTERKKRSLRQRKPYTRKRGTVHPKKKEATKRRAYAKRWATDPYGCLLNSYGSWSLDREKWDKHIAPLWKVYLPSELKVKRMQGYGTKEKPYTVYSVQVEHAPTRSVLYDGNSLEILELSSSLVVPSVL